MIGKVGAFLKAFLHASYICFKNGQGDVLLHLMSRLSDFTKRLTQ